MKLGLSIALAGVVILFGFLYTNRLMAQLKQLEMIISSIRLVKEKIRSNALETAEIFDVLILNFPDVFLERCVDVKEYVNYLENSKQLLLSDNQFNDYIDFLSGIGSTDRVGQIEHCDAYYETFINYLKCEKENSKNKIKLYPTLSVLLGVLCVVMFA